MAHLNKNSFSSARFWTSIVLHNILTQYPFKILIIWQKKFIVIFYWNYIIYYKFLSESKSIDLRLFMSMHMLYNDLFIPSFKIFWRFSVLFNIFFNISIRLLKLIFFLEGGWNGIFFQKYNFKQYQLPLNNPFRSLFLTDLLNDRIWEILYNFKFL